MFQLMRVDGATPQPVPSSVSATAVALTLMSSLHGPLGKLGRKRASVWSRSKSPVIAESGDTFNALALHVMLHLYAAFPHGGATAVESGLSFVEGGASV
jgi:hypothetical protein